MKRLIKGFLIAFAILLVIGFVVGAASEHTSSSKSSDAIFGKEYKTMDSLNADGDKIGEYAYISMDKDDFQDMSYKEIKKNFKKISKLSDKYDYFNIYFDDETGITLPGCDLTAATYGAKTASEYDDGYTIEPIGGYTAYIDDRDSYYVLVDEDNYLMSDGKEKTGINGIESDD